MRCRLCKPSVVAAAGAAWATAARSASSSQWGAACATARRGTHGALTGYCISAGVRHCAQIRRVRRGLRRLDMLHASGALHCLCRVRRTACAVATDRCFEVC
jgi:hypothetical protein